MQARDSLKKIFIAHQFSDDISDIVASVEALPVIVETRDKVPIGTALVKQLTKAIRSCSLFIGVISGEDSDSNIYFEAGVAAALSKPIIFVLSKQFLKLPPDADAVVRVERSDTAALSKYCSRLLQSRFRGRMQQSSTEYRSAPADALEERGNVAPVGSGEPRSPELIRRQKKSKAESRWEALRFDNTLEATIASDLAKTFQRSNIDFELTRERHGAADLILWSRSLAEAVGNPILVEIKGIIRSNREFEQVLSRAVEVLDANRLASAFLLIYQNAALDLGSQILPERFRMVSSAELFAALDKESVASYLKRLFTETAGPVKEH